MDVVKDDTELLAVEVSVCPRARAQNRCELRLDIDHLGQDGGLEAPSNTVEEGATSAIRGVDELEEVIEAEDLLITTGSIIHICHQLAQDHNVIFLFES